MTLGYNTLTPEARSNMLAEIGVGSIDDFFEKIPKEVRLKHKLNLPRPLQEWEIEQHMRELLSVNKTINSHKCFIGGGFYNHFIPKVIDAIVTRGEFLTSYTPYQPEMSQGLLQVLYEYQILISKLTGHNVVNSSCYDGGTALADAAWMTCLINDSRDNVILVQDSIWPQYQEILDTYMTSRNVELVRVPFDQNTGQMDLLALEQLMINHNPSGILIQSPNAFGVLEKVEKIASMAKDNDVISALSFNPLLSGLIKTPGELGIDIVTGEGQPLGLSLNAGGPSLGIFSTRERYRKYTPGRLVGMVTDIHGELAYSLVFEDREQHVAREKATSNICSNQALNAIRAAIYLASLGEKGLGYIANENFLKGKKLKKDLCSIPGVSDVFSGLTFNEFVVQLNKPVKEVISKMLNKGFFGGIEVDQSFGLSDAMLIAVTEKNSDEDLKEYVDCLKEVLGE